MDYEKKYKEALGWMQSLYKGLHGVTKEDAEHFFPELKESEEERNQRIKKEVIEMLNYYHSKSNCFNPPQFSLEETLAWLEKQGGDTNETINRDKFTQGVLKGAAINLITWIDYNAAKGNMCLSNMECKDIEDALVNGNWDKIYAYIKKKLEKQDEQKSIDSYCQENCKGFQETGKCFADGECKAKRDAEQNPDWSEEDEKHCRYIIDFYLQKSYGATAMAIEWLKNLKNRMQPHWKPTEEQLDVLQTAMRDYSYSREYYIIESLYNDLKKL